MTVLAVDPASEGDAKPPADSESPLPAMRTIVGLALSSAVLFAVGLEVTEAAGEFALDIDLKPFFVPYLLITFVRFRVSILAVGTGAAIGEGVLDMFEGYELEDPMGFIGYFFGFATFGWYLTRVADDPTAARSQTVAAVLGAFVQAVFEGTAFLVFESEAGTADAAASVLGNTVTHGIVLGAVPLLVLYPYVQERVRLPIDVKR